MSTYAAVKDETFARVLLTLFWLYGYADYESWMRVWVPGVRIVQEVV